MDLDRTRRNRAAMALLAVLATLILVAVVVVATVVSRAPSDERGHADSKPSGPTASSALSAERALARRPMPSLPVQAAAPQVLAEDDSKPIRIPPPTRVRGSWIPSGFPRTPEGALAQLAVTNERAMQGMDPAVVVRAHHAIAMPGAHDPTTSTLWRNARDFRAHAGLPESGPVPNLIASYEVTHGLVKGTADGGQFAVVCVLGEVTVDYQGSSATAGLGDCQAMRWANGQWRIASEVQAAPAPSAWPGSADAINVGYRELRDA